MINLAQSGETEASVMEVLEGADGFVHFDTILQSVVCDAVDRTHEVLEELKSRSVVMNADNRWRLRKRPTTALSLGGDPDFKRGDL